MGVAAIFYGIHNFHNHQRSAGRFNEDRNQRKLQLEKAANLILTNNSQPLIQTLRTISFQFFNDW